MAMLAPLAMAGPALTVFAFCVLGGFIIGRLEQPEVARPAWDFRISTRRRRPSFPVNQIVKELILAIYARASTIGRLVIGDRAG